MQNHQSIAESSNNLRNELLLEVAQTSEEDIPKLLELVRLFRQIAIQKRTSSQDWENAINEINHSDVVKRQARKAKIKNLFNSWNELETLEEQQEILEVINSLEDVSI